MSEHRLRLMEWLIILMGILIAILFICSTLGCSTQQQRAKMELIDDKTGSIYARADLSVTKTNFLYWSKFQAETDTFGMRTYVYNAEGRPDPEALQALVQAILEGMIVF